MKKHLVLVGAGHAHLTAMKNLQAFTEQHAVSVVSPGSYHYYSGMGPGMVSGIYSPAQIRFHVEKMVEDRGGKFIKDKVVGVDPLGKRLFLENGTALAYDIVSFNTGSRVYPKRIIISVTNRIFPVKPIDQLLKARQSILEHVKRGDTRIAVIGGGPAGIEMVCNIHRTVVESSGKADIFLIAGSEILPRFSTKVKHLTASLLTQKGIKVLSSVSVTRIDDSTIFLSDGNRLEADIIILATGVSPSPMFKSSGIPVGRDGGLLVNKYLQSVKHPEIFGGGDCIAFSPRPLQKVGVYAVRQNPILNQNLMAALNSLPMKPFVPQHNYLLIFNLGDKTGLVIWKNLVLSGRIAFWLKNAIDRKFMRSFQISGEQ